MKTSRRRDTLHCVVARRAFSRLLIGFSSVVFFQACLVAEDTDESPELQVAIDPGTMNVELMLCYPEGISVVRKTVAKSGEPNEVLRYDERFKVPKARSSSDKLAADVEHLLRVSIQGGMVLEATVDEKKIRVSIRSPDDFNKEATARLRLVGVRSVLGDPKSKPDTRKHFFAINREILTQHPHLARKGELNEILRYSVQGAKSGFAVTLHGSLHQEPIVEFPLNGNSFDKTVTKTFSNGDVAEVSRSSDSGLITSVKWNGEPVATEKEGAQYIIHAPHKEGDFVMTKHGKDTLMVVFAKHGIASVQINRKVLTTKERKETPYYEFQPSGDIFGKFISIITIRNARRLQ